MMMIYVNKMKFSKGPSFLNSLEKFLKEKKLRNFL